MRADLQGKGEDLRFQTQREMRMLMPVTELVTSEGERSVLKGKNVFGILCFGTLVI